MSVESKKTGLLAALASIDFTGEGMGAEEPQKRERRNVIGGKKVARAGVTASINACKVIEGTGLGSYGK